MEPVKPYMSDVTAVTVQRALWALDLIDGANRLHGERIMVELAGTIRYAIDTLRADLNEAKNPAIFAQPKPCTECKNEPCVGCKHCAGDAEDAEDDGPSWCMPDADSECAYCANNATCQSPNKFDAD